MVSSTQTSWPWGGERGRGGEGGEARGAEEGKESVEEERKKRGAGQQRGNVDVKGRQERRIGRRRGEEERGQG